MVVTAVRMGMELTWIFQIQMHLLLFKERGRERQGGGRVPHVFCYSREQYVSSCHCCFNIKANFADLLPIAPSGRCENLTEDFPMHSVSVSKGIGKSPLA